METRGMRFHRQIESRRRTSEFNLFTNKARAQAG